jgi:predicted RNA polymerase sigma factor
VQKRLDEASRLAATQELEEAAHVAERAVDAARATKDLGGEALAHALRARLLERLGRMEEAIGAWQAAATAWAAKHSSA